MTEMFRYLTGILEKEERKACRNYAFFSFICPVLDLLCYSELIHIINTAVRNEQVSRRLILFTLLMGGVSVAKILVDLCRCRMSGSFVYRNAQKLSMKLYEVLIKEDLERHNQKNAAQALTIIRNDAENCIGIITNCIDVYVYVLTMAGYAIALIHVSKWIGVISCLLLILSMIGIISLYRSQIKIYGEKYRTYGIKASSQISIAYGAFKEIKISDKGSLFLRRYGKISREYTQTQREFKYKSGATGAVIHGALQVVLFVVLGFLLMFGNNLPVILGLMLSYITALIRMVTIAYSIIQGINNVEFAGNSYEALREEFCQYEKIKERERLSENIREKRIHLKEGLSIKNLTFGYDQQNLIFEDASVNIPAGKSVAVTGISGIGKTTLLDLILGLLKPQSGSIFYDDYDIVAQSDGEGICRGNLGEIVSYIPQTIYLNGETVRNNVAFFENEDAIDDEKVREALACAQIWEDVCRMPEGVHTLIGENGTAISGGQRQRIALARALYRDFEILIMDEATTALDMETEKAVIDSIRQVKGNKTILMVTHHMSLARECDIIYAIENRKIVRVK